MAEPLDNVGRIVPVSSAKILTEIERKPEVLIPRRITLKGFPQDERHDHYLKDYLVFIEFPRSDRLIEAGGVGKTLVMAGEGKVAAGVKDERPWAIVMIYDPIVGSTVFGGTRIINRDECEWVEAKEERGPRSAGHSLHPRVKERLSKKSCFEIEALMGQLTRRKQPLSSEVTIDQVRSALVAELSALPLRKPELAREEMFLVVDWERQGDEVILNLGNRDLFWQ